jgi:NADH-quinone oxidoreductase subunit J
MIQALGFYLFAAVILVSAICVISVRNPVHSVLFLILAFFNAAGLFVMLGAEFVAMILVIVYVGAVAVLFLFVVMMLDISFASMRKGAMQYVLPGLILGAVLLTELILIYSSWQFAPGAKEAIQVPAPDAGEGMSNTQALGRVLYTDYIYAFQAAGMILLVAMIGAIVLTLRHRGDVRRQTVEEQNRRDPDKVVENVDVPPGTGVF